MPWSCSLSFTHMMMRTAFILHMDGGVLSLADLPRMHNAVRPGDVAALIGYHGHLCGQIKTDRLVLPVASGQGRSSASGLLSLVTLSECRSVMSWTSPQTSPSRSRS